MACGNLAGIDRLILSTNYVERLNLFVGWPLTEAVHPEKLARAGFAYTGVGDAVKCLQCGVQHRNWHPGDNPPDMHHPCCPFLQPDDVAVEVAVVPSGLHLFLSFGDLLQQCEYRDDQTVHVVPQVPQGTLSSSRSSPKEGKAGCNPFKHNGGKPIAMLS